MRVFMDEVNEQRSKESAGVMAGEGSGATLGGAVMAK